MPRFKVYHCTFTKSWVDSFLGKFSKTSLDAYFNLTSDIFLKSAMLKNQERKSLCKILENMIFAYYFNNFNQNCGCRNRLLFFILAIEQSIKSFSFIFLGFCLYFKSTFTIKKFMNDFWNDFNRTPHDGCFC